MGVVKNSSPRIQRSACRYPGDFQRFTVLQRAPSLPYGLHHRGRRRRGQIQMEHVATFVVAWSRLGILFFNNRFQFFTCLATRSQGGRLGTRGGCPCFISISHWFHAHDLALPVCLQLWSLVTFPPCLTTRTNRAQPLIVNGLAVGLAQPTPASTPSRTVL